MTSWINWQAPIYAWSDKKIKLRDVPYGTIVEVQAAINGMTLCEYIDTTGKKISGWVDQKYLERYVHAPGLRCDVVAIEDATPDPNDPKQFIFWKGIKQVNMCGELCVAFLTGKSLREVLTDWEVKLPSFFRRIFSGGKATGTSNADLIALFALHGLHASPLSLAKYTPGKLEDLFVRNEIIVGVRINTAGELRGGHILHWVALTNITLDRKMMGWVTVYNPYNNCEELYSWDEFVKAAGSPYGVLISHPEVMK